MKSLAACLTDWWTSDQWWCLLWTHNNVSVLPVSMEYKLAFRNGIKYSIWLATWYNANLWIKWPANILVWWLNITDQLSVTVLMLYVSRKPGLMWWINWLELFWPSASCYLVGAMMMINAMWFLFLDVFIFNLEYCGVTF